MNRIRELREAGGLKQADLAKMMSCTVVTVSRYERGEREIDSATISRLCDIFNCTADYLICRSNAQRSALSPEDAAFLAALHEAPENVKAAIRALLKTDSGEVKEKQRAS
jgi:transcriptional regulator with XRE-family HTH domain